MRQLVSRRRGTQHHALARLHVPVRASDETLRHRELRLHAPRGARVVSRGPRVAIRGTVAVVTGAGSGIGRVTALSLSARGATVVCADIDGETAEKVAAEGG